MKSSLIDRSCVYFIDCWIDKLLERAMIRKNETDDPDIDAESYSEVKAVADEIMDLHEDAFKELA